MVRRLTLLALFALALTLALPVGVPLGAESARADHDEGPEQVYFPETGHHLSNAFLDFWRHNGGLDRFGYPLTEEISEDGQTVQYLERAVFEWHPDSSSEWRVQLRRLGRELHGDRGQQAFEGLGGDGDGDTQYFPETDHQLGEQFEEYWEDGGGVRIFGYPISEAFEEDGTTVQYFERARFEWHADNEDTDYEVLLGRLGRDAAEENDVDTSPVSRGEDVDDYHLDLWSVPTPSTPADVQTPPAGAPVTAGKWIEVDLSQQYLRAWEGDSVVYGTYVSTGTSRYPTPTGTYQVFSKILSHTMTGGTPGDDYYYLENVPHSMYYAAGGYAIHGAYWHNNFGAPMSHGCVNLPLGAAEWMYDWSPMGTTVWVHY